MKFMSPTEDAIEGRNTQETRDFHPSDQRLRDKGFWVHSRPKSGPAIWARKRPGTTEVDTFTQEEAFALLAKLES